MRIFKSIFYQRVNKAVQMTLKALSFAAIGSISLTAITTQSDIRIQTTIELCIN
jgi:hypothetical protein